MRSRQKNEQVNREAALPAGPGRLPRHVGRPAAAESLGTSVLDAPTIARPPSLGRCDVHGPQPAGSCDGEVSADKVSEERRVNFCDTAEVTEYVVDEKDVTPGEGSCGSPELTARPGTADVHTVASAGNKRGRGRPRDMPFTKAIKALKRAEEAYLQEFCQEDKEDKEVVGWVDDPFESSSVNERNRERAAARQRKSDKIAAEYEQSSDAYEEAQLAAAIELGRKEVRVEMLEKEKEMRTKLIDEMRTHDETKQRLLDSLSRCKELYEHVALYQRLRASNEALEEAREFAKWSREREQDLWLRGVI